MIKGKTKTGFEFEVEENVIDDMRIVEAVANIVNGTEPLAVVMIVNKILGEQQKERLYQYLEESDGRVSIEKVSNAITDIFEAFGSQGKNSLSLPE